jgi:hypothetical protein
MRQFLTMFLIALTSTLSAQSDYYLPYNPDSNEDGYVYLIDLLDLLSVFGSEYSPQDFSSDSTSAILNLGPLQYAYCLAAIHQLESNWTLMPIKAVGLYPDELTSISNESSQTFAWCDPKVDVFQVGYASSISVPAISLISYSAGYQDFSSGQLSLQSSSAQYLCIAYIEASRSIIDYIWCSTTSCVNQKLTEGYVPYGGVGGAGAYDGWSYQINYFQAMVKWSH